MRRNKQFFSIITTNFLFAILLFLIGIFLFLFADHYLYQVIHKQKDKLFSNIKDRTGYELHYSSIHPYILSGITISDVKLIDRFNHETITLGEVKVKYSILSYLKDRSSILNLLSKIEIKNLDLDFDFRRLPALLSSFSKPPHEREKGFPAISHLILQISNSKIKLHFNDNYHANSNVHHLRLHIFDRKMNMKANMDNNIFQNNKLFSHFSFQTAGELDLTGNNCRLNLMNNLNEIQIGKLKIKEQKFSFKMDSAEEKIEILRQKDSLPLNVEILKKKEEVKAKIETQNLNAAYLFTSEESQNFFEQIEDWSSKITMEANLKNHQFTGEASGSFLYQSLGILGDSKGQFHLHWNDHLLTAEHLSLQAVHKNQSIEGKGNFNFKSKAPDFKIDVQNLSLLSSIINSQIQIKNNKEKGKIDISSGPIKINNTFLPSFSYCLFTKKENQRDRIWIQTEKPFNGLMVNTLPNSTSSSNRFLIRMDHFQISPFLPPSKNTSDLKTKTIPAKRSLSLSSDLVLNFHEKNIILEPGSLIIRNQDKPLLQLQAALNSGILSLSKIRLQDKKIPWDLKGRLPFLYGNSKDQIDFSLYNDRQNYSFFLQNTKEHLSLFYRSSPIVSFQKKDKNLTVSLDRFQLPFSVRSQQPKLTLHINFRGDQAELSNSYFQMDNLALFQEQTGRISGNLQYKNKQFHLLNLQYSDKENSIRGEITGEVRNNSQISASALLSDKNKNESYSFNFSLEEGIINGKAFITNMELKKIAGKDYKGSFNLRIGIKNQWFNPDISVEGDIKNGRLNNSVPIRGLLLAKKSGNQVKINNLFLNRGKWKCEIKDSSFLWENKQIKDLQINGVFDTQIIARKIKSDFRLSGDFLSMQEFSGNLQLQKNSITYLKSGNPVRTDKLDNIQLKIVRKNERTTIETMNSNTLKMLLLKNGLVVNLFDHNRRIASANILLDNQNLKGTVDLFHFAIKPISVVTLPVVELTDGFLNGRLQISGKLSDPLFSGQMSLYYGEVLIPDYLQRPISGISGIINGNGKKLLVNNVCGSSGEGLVSGYGEICFNKNQFDSYSFIVSSDSIPARFQMANVDVQGRGTVNYFLLEGAPKNFVFNGDILVNQADININNYTLRAEEKKERPKIGAPIYVSLKFTVGKKVDVNYPLISGTLVQGNNLTMNYSAIDNSFSFLGNIDVKSGKINYLNRIFKIEDASLQFDGAEGMNPLVNLTSYYNTKDSDKNNVKIYLTMNDRLFSFKTKFYSSPQLPEDELNQLLGLPSSKMAETEKNNNKNFGLDSIQNTTNYLGNTFLFSPFENSIRKTLNLDTFSLNTEIFGNLLASNTSFVELLNNSSLAVGKYIFDGFYVESMMTFNKKGDINDHVFLMLPNTNYGFNLQLQVMLELPFVSLGYSFKPRDLNNFTNVEQTISIETGFKF